MKSRIAIAVLLLIKSFQGIALGDEFRIIPNLTIKEEYNSNIYLDSNSASAKKDFISVISHRGQID